MLMLMPDSNAILRQVDLLASLPVACVVDLAAVSSTSLRKLNRPRPLMAPAVLASAAVPDAEHNGRKDICDRAV